LHIKSDEAAGGSFNEVNLLINTTPALLLDARPIGLALRGTTLTI
jgi:hypothetical protein